MRRDSRYNHKHNRYGDSWPMDCSIQELTLSIPCRDFLKRGFVEVSFSSTQWPGRGVGCLGYERALVKLWFAGSAGSRKPLHLWTPLAQFTSFANSTWTSKPLNLWIPVARRTSLAGSARSPKSLHLWTPLVWFRSYARSAGRPETTRNWCRHKNIIGRCSSYNK